MEVEEDEQRRRGVVDWRQEEGGGSGIFSWMSCTVWVEGGVASFLRSLVVSVLYEVFLALGGNDGFEGDLNIYCGSN